ncbi:MAG: universal stress protein [Azonexus sp.]|jgi:nucleotide-binding universal stress UspA family protein|nr:universal stress protein [Azonexus sp.]
MYKHILLPTDGSRRSEKAIRAGINLAKQLGAQVTAIFVSEATYIEQIDTGRKPHAEEALAFATKQAEAVGMTCAIASVVGDTPAQSIIDYAEAHQCDVIIMGTHGRTKVGKLLLGSVAASVLADCDIPLILYR